MGSNRRDFESSCKMRSSIKERAVADELSQNAGITATRLNNGESFPWV